MDAPDGVDNNVGKDTLFEEVDGAGDSKEGKGMVGVGVIGRIMDLGGVVEEGVGLPVGVAEGETEVTWR